MIINENNLGNYIIPEDVFGGICIDIGANNGNFVKQNYSRFKEIYTYEPIKILYEKILNFNIDNVKVFNEAVSDNIGETQIIFHTNTETGSSSIRETIDNVIVLKNDWTNDIINKVKSVDLETVINRTGSKYIDYLKMDCENSEFLILLNKDLSKIKYIGIELHNQMGKNNWDKLKDWVSNTHLGFPDYNGHHHEVLLINKNL